MVRRKFSEGEVDDDSTNRRAKYPPHYLASRVPKSPGAPQDPAVGLSRTSDGAGLSLAVCPGQRNPRMAVFGPNDGLYRMRQCFSRVRL